MIRNFFQLTICLFFVVSLFACSSTNNKPLLIDFSADSSSIVIRHIDRAGFLQLKQHVGNDSLFKSLVSVLETPAANEDTDFVERPVYGKFQLTDSDLIFIPQLSFVKGRSYLVVTHLNSKFGDAKMLLKGKLKPGVQPLQKKLTR